MHENDGDSAGRDTMVDAVLTASRVLVAIAARSLADAGAHRAVDGHNPAPHVIVGMI